MSAKKSKSTNSSVARIETKIHEIRGVRVILDVDLALAYGVETKVLNQAIKRNPGRFPDDFIFQITPEEASALDRLRSQIVTSNTVASENASAEGNLRSQYVTSSSDTVLVSPSDSNLRSQIVISRPGRGGRRYLPFAFTEHGAMMAATILNSPRAVEMSVFVVRAFISMRELLSKHREIDSRLGELENKIAGHDSQIHGIIKALRKLMTPPTVERKPMGFRQQADLGTKAKKRRLES